MSSSEQIPPNIASPHRDSACEGEGCAPAPDPCYSDTQGHAATEGTRAEPDLLGACKKDFTSAESDHQMTAVDESAVDGPTVDGPTVDGPTLDGPTVSETSLADVVDLDSANSVATSPAGIASYRPAQSSLRHQMCERLPNGSVGKPYSFSLCTLFGDEFHRVAELKLVPPVGSGLALDDSKALLQGTPSMSGEIEVVIRFRLIDTGAGQPDFAHKLALTINPDPSSLWKNLPSDGNGAFAKPDTCSSFLSTPHLTVIAASLRGRSHAHEGKYREDDFCIQYMEEPGWHIFICADGAGSAKFSRRGSELACKTALQLITDKLGREDNQLNAALVKLSGSQEPADLEKLRQLSYNVLMLSAHQAHTAIQKQAKESQATPRDFASTFIVVISRVVESRWFFASFAIGDGGAGALLDDGTLLSLTAPDSGDFAGQTVFVTMPQVFSDTNTLLGRTKAAFCHNLKFIAVMTDGITDPIFQSDANLASSTEWEKWQQQLAQVVNFDTPTPGVEGSLLDYLNFPSPGNHDDRTLLIAVPNSAKP